ncbi:unnamed protein product [Pseudo-nitzschia multistriata]|uniref:Uncharacterized protein n=1 Tax=Pseudo-nitzschia multistriata TaxID=183589 RepID=A0A448ZLV4_9STRA|nr:unnamed protein product [Pseudo-nitzschia multistriata]
MPLTRSSRKRLTAGEGGNAIGTANNEPRIKRQKTGSDVAKTSAAAATAKVRKARALKPVATNAKAQSKSNATHKQHDVATKPVTRGASSYRTAAHRKASKTAKANGVPPSKKAAPPAKRGRSAKATNQQPMKEQEYQEHHFLPYEETASSTTSALPDTEVVRSEPKASEEASSGNDCSEAKPPAPVNAVEKDDVIRSKDLSTADGIFSNSSYQNGVPDDIDARDAHDPLSVTDYVADMYEHFRSKEEMCSVDYMYMGSAVHGKQPNINESMRCILVDWLIEVHYKFKLFPETLYLTVNVLDRFLSQTTELITKRDLQLVGVTALLVSAKYEEMYVPELRDLTYICDGAYTEARILRMEEKILKTLNYNVTVPTPHTFLIRFLKAAHADTLMAQLACFLLDGTLLSLEKLTCLWRPSQLAAAAILLARRHLGRHNWSPTLVSYSYYREEDVLPVARALLKNKERLENNRELLALAKKYSKTKYGKVSHIEFEPFDDQESSGDESIENSL